MGYQIIPIHQSFLDKVRCQAVDDLNQPVEYVTARGGEPCRDVLRRAKPGEELILASYCPFERVGPYREYGPVFVLAHAAAQSVDYHFLPLSSSHSVGYLAEQFILRAYNFEEEIVDAAIVNADGAENRLIQFLAMSQVKFVLARFPTYGCFACRLEGDD